ERGINDLIAQKVDGLIMNISPIETLPGPMEAITKAGIPVVLVNRRFLGTGYDSWIGVDNKNTGAGIGRVIVDAMRGRGNLLMIRGGPEDNHIGNARRDGVLSMVEPTDIEVIFAPAFGGWTEDGGFRLMEDMLAKHPNLNAVFAENDSMALGAVKAIQDAGRAGRIQVFGFDGQRAALKMIADRTNFIATGLNSPSLIGPMGFNHLMAVIAGAERANIDTVFPVTVITRDNVAQFYNPDSVF
ncbi:MAG TPA: substrate-binding domain-containing protein, partial [Magnetospirillaceae bacterium]|nr:substrate-binding domain-containing protein [Magnetospirillaceae bacterium]